MSLVARLIERFRRLQFIADIVEILYWTGPVPFLASIIFAVGGAVLSMGLAILQGLPPLAILFLTLAAAFAILLLLCVLQLLIIEFQAPDVSSAKRASRKIRRRKTCLPDTCSYEIRSLSEAGNPVSKALTATLKRCGLSHQVGTAEYGYRPFFSGIRAYAADDDLSAELDQITDYMREADLRFDKRSLPLVTQNTVMLMVGFPPYSANEPRAEKEPDGFPASIHVPGDIMLVDCVDSKSPTRRFYVVWNVRITARKKLSLDAHLRIYGAGNMMLAYDPEREILDYLERNKEALGKTSQSPLLPPVSLTEGGSIVGYIVFGDRGKGNIVQPLKGRRNRSVVFKDHLSGSTREVELLPEPGRAPVELRDKRAVIAEELHDLIEKGIEVRNRWVLNTERTDEQIGKAVDDYARIFRPALEALFDKATAGDIVNIEDRFEVDIPVSLSSQRRSNYGRLCTWLKRMSKKRREYLDL